MPNLLSQLTKDERARFLDELYYLNLEEIRGFCSDRRIPYKILAEYPDGKTKATKDTDRKPIVLARIRRYYLTDLKHKRAGSDWKTLRNAKAKSALRTLAGIAPLPGETACHAR